MFRRNKSLHPQQYPHSSQQHLTPSPQLYDRQDTPHDDVNILPIQSTQPLKNKSILDGFDNNNSSLLNDNKSFARNIRGRLLNFENPEIQKAKEDKKKAYREQLRKQMEQDRKRKERQKKYQQELQIKRQKQFYERVKIQAQKKSPISKIDDDEEQNPSRVKSKQKSKVDNYVQNQKEQKNKKAKGNYHHDKNKKKKLNSYPDKTYQDERIEKINYFQENLMRKLDSMKSQIRATISETDLDRQVEKVRFKLKGNPLYVEKGQQTGEVMEANAIIHDFYSLPKMSRVIKPSRQQFQVLLTDKRPKVKKKEENINELVDEIDHL